MTRERKDDERRLTMSVTVIQVTSEPTLPGCTKYHIRYADGFIKRFAIGTPFSPCRLTMLGDLDITQFKELEVHYRRMEAVVHDVIGVEVKPSTLVHVRTSSAYEAYYRCKDISAVLTLPTKITVDRGEVYGLSLHMENCHVIESASDVSRALYAEIRTLHAKIDSLVDSLNTFVSLHDDDAKHS